MTGSNINWIGTSLAEYISVKLVDEKSVSFYFTKSILNKLKSQYNNFFDKEDNRYNLMVGFDENENKILFKITKEVNVYTSAFTLTSDGDEFKGKPKKITNKVLRDFVESISSEEKFKLVDYDLASDDDGIIITFYLDDIIYY